MTLREALTTAEGIPCYRSPRSAAQWGAEWALIGSVRLLDRAHRLYTLAGRPDRADYVLRLVEAGVLVEEAERARPTPTLWPGR